MLGSFLVVFSSCVVLCVGFSESRDIIVPDVEHTECGPNEESRCVNSCPPEKVCGDYEEYLCLAVVQYCSDKCVCKEGFIRDLEGNCITKKQCGKCQGPNEGVELGLPCDNVCATLHIQNKTDCPLEDDGHYLRQLGHRCYCNDGYARDNTGNCIPIDECRIQEKCPGANEHYACGGPCDNVCAALHLQNKTDCLQEYQECQPSCYCDDGYARDESGTCIPIEKCPPRSCGKHEVMTDCKKACPPTADIYQRIFGTCNNTDPCEPGCECELQYYRKDQNVPDSPCIHMCKHELFKALPVCPLAFQGSTEKTTSAKSSKN